MMFFIDRANDNRDGIEPKFEGLPRPNIVEILKLLPKTNCRKCGEPTCLVFASRIAEGAKDESDCKELEIAEGEKLSSYLSQFVFE